MLSIINKDRNYKIIKGEIKMIGRMIQEKRREIDRRKRMETAKSVATGTILGTAIGAVAGVLLAPKSGEETREEIAVKSKEVAESVKETVNLKMEEAKEWKEKATADFKSKAEKVMDTTEAISEELEEGMAEVGEIIGDTAEEIKKEIK